MIDARVVERIHGAGPEPLSESTALAPLPCATALALHRIEMDVMEAPSDDLPMAQDQPEHQNFNVTKHQTELPISTFESSLLAYISRENCLNDRIYDGSSDF